MKKAIIILSLVVGLVFTFSSCSDYLDSDYIFDERLSIEEVFTNRDYTHRWLARGYNFLSSDFLQDICSKNKVPFNFADDMYFGDTNDQYRKWKNGEYNERGFENNSYEIWQNAYKGIRHISIFINNVDMNQELSRQDVSDMKGQAHFLRAYFYWILLRTYGPIPLVPDEGIDYTKEYDEIARPRNTYDECTEYINNELIKAAKILSPERDMQNTARPTRGAALALRARILVYAASPMFNGKAPAEVAAAMIDKQGNLLLSSVEDVRKWARAAAAAKDVMDLQKYDLYTAPRTTQSTSPLYPLTVEPPKDDVNLFHQKNWPYGWANIDPFESYRSLFNGTAATYSNREIIFTRGQNQGGYGINILAIHQLPRKEGKGYNCHGITQKQVDAYYMNDGSDCPGMNDMYAGTKGYENPLRYNTAQKHLTDIVTTEEVTNYPELGPLGKGVCKQYVRREPRFYASVAYNGSTWGFEKAEKDKDEVKDVQVWFYRDDPNGYKNSTYWLRTGIGVKKYIHPDDISNTQITANDQSRMHQKMSPDIRYAEILLIYAEALNELGGNSYDIPSWDESKTYTVSRLDTEMKKGIHPIRIRAGVPDYSSDIYGDPDKFRIKLKRERQIELFAEAQRYFDLRRWCDAPAEEDAPIYGCNAYSTSKMPENFHTPVETPSLPSIFTTKMWFWPIHHDELKRNMKLTQNPGWTYPE